MTVCPKENVAALKGINIIYIDQHFTYELKMNLNS